MDEINGVGRECLTGPVPTFRVVLRSGGAGFLLDILDHSWAVFSRGDAVTLAAIASGSGRPWHGWVWLVSGIVCVLFCAFVVGSVAELWIKQLKEGS